MLTDRSYNQFEYGTGEGEWAFKRTDNALLLERPSNKTRKILPLKVTMEKLSIPAIRFQIRVSYGRTCASLALRHELSVILRTKGHTVDGTTN